MFKVWLLCFIFDTFRHLCSHYEYLERCSSSTGLAMNQMIVFEQIATNHQMMYKNTHGHFYYFRRREILQLFLYFSPINKPTWWRASKKRLLTQSANNSLWINFCTDIGNEQLFCSAQQKRFTLMFFMNGLYSRNKCGFIAFQYTHSTATCFYNSTKWEFRMIWNDNN